MEDTNDIQKRIEELEAQMGRADFWNDKVKAQTAVKELQDLKAALEGVGKYDKGPAIMSVLSGAGGGNITLEVPKDTDVLWGDVFVYPGIAPSVLGSVYYIDNNSQSAFKTVYIRVPGNLFSAQWVFVEKNS